MCGALGCPRAQVDFVMACVLQYLVTKHGRSGDAGVEIKPLRGRGFEDEDDEEE